MIEITVDRFEPFHVVCVETGDYAEATTPEEAVCAGRQLRRDARAGGCGKQPTIRFYCEGMMVREARGAF